MKRNGKDRAGSCGGWLWAAADNLRLSALNAVRIAEELAQRANPRAASRQVASRMKRGAPGAELRTSSTTLIAVALVLGLAGNGCGYHVAGKGAQIPAEVKTIAVPAFRNETSRYKIEQVLSRAVVRELLARTRFRVQPEPDGSDAVLSGTVIQFWTTPVLVESSGGRTTSVSMAVRMRVKLTDHRTGKLLFENPDYQFSEIYEISGDAATYFEESGPAVERLSRSFAASLVSSLLEAF